MKIKKLMTLSLMAVSMFATANNSFIFMGSFETPVVISLNNSVSIDRTETSEKKIGELVANNQTLRVELPNNKYCFDASNGPVVDSTSSDYKVGEANDVVPLALTPCSVTPSGELVGTTAEPVVYSVYTKDKTAIDYRFEVKEEQGVHSLYKRKDVTFDTAGTLELTIVGIKFSEKSSFGFSGTVEVLTEEPPNNPPTAVKLDGGSVSKTAAVETVVGTLSTIDPDSDDTHTYSITSGNDAGHFKIVNNQLRLATSLANFTGVSITLEITSDDGSATVADTFDISFSRFVKLGTTGQPISDQTSSSFACVHDTENNLIWEVKQSSGLHSALDIYTWYDSSEPNGPGYLGIDSSLCYGNNQNTNVPSEYCNTQAFVARVNKAKLCGKTGWRLPTKVELGYIHDVTEGPKPFINKAFFPNTPATNTRNGSLVYWTSDNDNGQNAWAWVFSASLTPATRNTYGADKNKPLSARLVRTAN